MKFPLFVLVFSFSLPIHAQVASQQTAARPKITGISHIAVYSSDAAKTGDYYMRIVGCDKEADFETSAGILYSFNPHQYVEVLPLPEAAGADRLDHLAYVTSDADALRRYLISKSAPNPGPLMTAKSGIRWFTVEDFEGNKVQFVEYAGAAGVQPAALSPKLVGHHIIHVGMLIRDREAADRFYRDILGFRPYWHGGMKPDKTDWVAMQVPDGTDWLEYMLTSGPSGSGAPAVMSQKALGVLDHLSVGVPDMAAAVATLKSEQRVGPEGSGPQMGKDGKWQFNDFDPDEIRLEYMEFTPVQKPCCSPFTGPHPTAGGD